MQTVKIAVSDHIRHVDIDLLHDLQGELKTLSREAYDQLKKEILETGFAWPIHCWDDNGKLWILGGNQRKRVLESMRHEGYTIPPVPIITIFADSLEQALRRILQDATQYGHIEGQGMYELLVKAKIAPGDFASSFSFPDFDIPKFNAEYFFDNVTGADQSLESGAASSGQLPTPLLAPATSQSSSPPPEEKRPSQFDHKCPRCGFSF